MRRLLAVGLLLAAQVASAQDAPATHYIPQGTFSERNQPFRESWFGGHLKSMEEPVLWEARAIDGYRSRFRMLVLPTFHRPYVIGIDERPDGKVTLRFTRTEGRGGYGDGPIGERVRTALSPAAWARLKAALAAARFGERLPDNRSGAEFAGSERRDNFIVCLDGTQLVFEMRTAEGHRFVTRHECTLDAPMRTLAAEVLAAAGRKPDPSQGDPEPPPIP